MNQCRKTVTFSYSVPSPHRLFKIFSSGYKTCCGIPLLWQNEANLFWFNRTCLGSLEPVNARAGNTRAHRRYLQAILLLKGLLHMPPRPPKQVTANKRSTAKDYSDCAYPQSSNKDRVQSSVWRFPNYWPPTPSPPSEFVLPPHQRRGEDTLAGQWRGWGGNSLEHVWHWIGLLQYNPSTRLPKCSRQKSKCKGVVI